MSTRGSDWGKWDLQVQPIKQEWLCNIRANPGKVVAATTEFIHQAVRAGIRLVAVTDHNCGIAVDVAIAVVQREELPLVVLSGVEIDAPGGYQVLVIMNPEYLTKTRQESWGRAIEHFLNHTCGISSPVTNSDGCAEPINRDIHEVLHRVCIEDMGVPILAHVHGDKGLFKKATASIRQKFFSNQMEGKYYFALDHKSNEQVAATIQTLSGWGVDPRKFALVKTSDAHQASDVGSVYTWVKADRTYEGLKQIIYDPASRISQQSQEPARPTNAISSVTFNVPEHAVLRVRHKDGKDTQERFCFAGVSATFELSPFFNCFIGGRGSGKSTVLNFLGQHATDPSSSQAFWKRIQPSFDTKDRMLFSFAGVETFEYIGQSEVESFATNKAAFTNAIYERANILSDDALQKCDGALSRALGKLGGFRDMVAEIDRLNAGHETKSREKRTLEGSIRITQSDEYLAIVETIQNKTNDKQRLESWRAGVTDLREAIASLERIPDFESADADVKAQLATDETDVARVYVEAFMEAHRNIDAATKILDARNFEVLEQLEEAIGKEIAENEGQLSALLAEAGLSQENILQIKSAPQKLVRIGDELTKLRKRIDEREAELARYDQVLAEIEQCKAEYETAINGAIAPLVEVLDEQARENQKKDIRNIGLNYFFDSEGAWHDIASDVHREFGRQYGDGERGDFVRGYILEHRDVFSSDHNAIKDLLGREERTAGYVKFLRDAFSTGSAFQIFRTIRDGRLNDVSKYKRIQVLYDARDIERASFGQKCTAVMVILLLFGNYPLIIDEPEAHLDSSLIANYLVPLIKRKKSSRQLVFSTHNANFVVNGDAEKIFILKNETGTTEILEATIEDLARREELLKLEGGREAFRKRGEKLHI